MGFDGQLRICHVDTIQGGNAAARRAGSATRRHQPQAARALVGRSLGALSQSSLHNHQIRKRPSLRHADGLLALQHCVDPELGCRPFDANELVCPGRAAHLRRGAMRLRFVFFSCATWAISHMVLSDASVLIFTAPILLFFLGVAFLKDKVECIDVVCALVGLGGALFVIRPVFLFQSKQIVQVASTLAIVSALVAALAKAAAFVLLRHLPTLHYFVAIHYLMLTCSLFSGIWIALDERVFHYEMDLYAWLGVGAIGVLGFLGEIGLTKGAHVENVGLAFVLRYLGVVLVFVWDALLLREVISPWSVVGAVVTLVFVGIIAWRRCDRPRRPAAATV
ncbi:hypothetical protein Ae201684_016402 [Aphanomyces euteiches]|uniref:EamA domain-containing protein n=1 Tax=Aphanomyces euteiches TaxID=100861 RepID=A0A6G0WDF2_9STRA|nr:hypothetical protein Ae201684_016402 [Aphanomyces euteiches]